MNKQLVLKGLTLYKITDTYLYEQYGNNPDQQILTFLELMKMPRDKSVEEMLLTAQSIATRLRAASVPFFSDGARYNPLLCWLLGITVTNPLPSHYHCPLCHRIEWTDSRIDGFDLPPKPCECGGVMEGDGHNGVPEYSYFSGQYLWPIHFFVRQESLPFCLTLEPEEWFEIPENAKACKFEDNSQSQFGLSNIINTLPLTLQIRNRGLEIAGWHSWYDRRKLTTILTEHHDEVFIFREDIFKFLVNEQDMNPEKAIRYAERIRKSRGGDRVDELFSKNDWRCEYCKAILYLPSRAEVAEEQVRLHGRFFLPAAAER